MTLGWKAVFSRALSPGKALSDRSPLVEKDGEDGPNNDSDRSSYTLSCRKILALLACMGCVNIYTVRVNLNVALVAMVNNSYYINETLEHDLGEDCPGETPSLSAREREGDFNWDSKQQGIILGAFFYGYVLTQVPGGWVAENYGGTRIYGYSVLCSSVLSMFTPLAASFGANAVVGLRVLEGIGEGPTFPAMHAILAVWVPSNERTKIGAIVYSGIQLGTVIVLPISGWLCDCRSLGGWRGVFYLFGCLGCLWYVAWSMLIYDTPAKHPRISAAEKRYIESHVGCMGQRPCTPWRDIARSHAFWSLAVVHVMITWNFYTMLACMPKYMKDVLKFDISQNGMVCAMPYAINWVLMIACGQIADYLRTNELLTTASVRKLFNVVGLMVPAIFLVSATYVGCRKVLAVALLTAAASVSGVSVASGYGVNHLDIAPRFAGTLMGITNSMSCFSGVFGPMVVGFLTSTTSNILQWRKAFFICLGASVFGCFTTLVFTAGEEQPWAKLQTEEPMPGCDGVHNSQSRRQQSRTSLSSLRVLRTPEKEH